jgi:hypothetical protein
VVAISNKSKASASNIDAVMIGRATQPDLPLVGSLGRKLSKADNKAFTAALATFSASSPAFLPAS